VPGFGAVITNFESKTGDVCEITYENEVLVGQQSGQDYELIIPCLDSSRLRPVALDKYVDKHGTRGGSRSLRFLYQRSSEVLCQTHGFALMFPAVASETSQSIHR